jgi:hypothetical protein
MGEREYAVGGLLRADEQTRLSLEEKGVIMVECGSVKITPMFER